MFCIEEWMNDVPDQLSTHERALTDSHLNSELR